MKLDERTRGGMDLGNLRGRTRENSEKVHCTAFSDINKRKNYTIIIKQNSNMLFVSLLCFVLGEGISIHSFFLTTLAILGLTL